MLAINFNIGTLIFIISSKGLSETNGIQTFQKTSGLEDVYFSSKLPEFDRTKSQNVTALVGKTTFLACSVKNLKHNQKVSWIRHKDVHILTAGERTFTTDQRFSAKHNTDDEWVLVIKYVQERDAGIYECQIPTQPPQAYQIKLNVIVPHVGIQGSPDLHVDRGSMINLTCTISHTPEPPAYIFWYHNDQVVAYDSPRGGITVLTENGEDTRSHLIIKNARGTDSGNYTCKPSIFKTATVRLHVLQDDPPRELHHTSDGSASVTFSPVVFVLSILLETSTAVLLAVVN
ncbi:zwei Ig domain protein zig-8 [Eurytemora carolleeae]|uniref:zwei Ig domain protein zig-8 n=1 Tax=Eurytemora carolleeae TaxID=1294199 RepID=UPI000C7698D3|nr:zwei Ig domain protein zig-8 [Eurytemora carolleeae]|eukprot:XP_023329668.1 zwei Ig domain protein zig-8-like [Eurytemora affinis]